MIVLCGEKENLLKKYDANDKSEYFVVYKKDYGEQIKYDDAKVQETSQETAITEPAAATPDAAKKKTQQSEGNGYRSPVIKVLLPSANLRKQVLSTYPISCRLNRIFLCRISNQAFRQCRRPAQIYPANLVRFRGSKLLVQ